MAKLLDDDDPVVLFSIPLKGETIDRLMNLSNICHADPRSVAASLLHDILKDDEESHMLLAPPTGDVTIN